MRIKALLFTLAFSLFAFVPQNRLLATQQGATPVLPAAKFTGVVKTFRGHEMGYMPPKEGDRFVLYFHDVEDMKDALKFGDEKNRYVPLPGKLVLKDSDGGENFYKWRSFRAVAQDSTMKVTMDALRKPGFGHQDYTVIWVLIESHGRISGVLEIHGKVEPPIN